MAGQPAFPAQRPAVRGVRRLARRILGAVQLVACTFVALSLVSWSVSDPSLTHISSGTVHNWMGPLGAIISDLLVQLLGVASIIAVFPPAYWAAQWATTAHIDHPRRKLVYAPFAVIFLALAWSSLPELASMPFRHGFGGVVGDILYARVTGLLGIINATRAGIAAGLFGLAAGLFCLQRALGVTRAELMALLQWPIVASWNTTAAAPVRALADAGPVDPRNWSPPSPPQPVMAPFVDQTYRSGSPPHSASPLNNPDRMARWHQHPSVNLDPRMDTCAERDVGLSPASSDMLTSSAIAASRQAWLRPIRQNPVASVAGVPAERLAASDRRQAPAFDHETDHQSRAIAQRFAPQGMDVPSAAVMADYDGEPRFEPSLDQTHAERSYRHPEDDDMRYAAPRHAEPNEPDFALPAAPPREPTIIMPHQPETPSSAPLVDRTINVAPGGFFARLTAGHRSTRPDADADPVSLHYRRPSLNLLERSSAPAHNDEITTAKLRERSQLLLETLGDFGIKGEIVAVRPGPVVTLFEFEPARGTKSSRVIGLADDIARSMSARAVRIAVVPGVNAIGIELPNATREGVGFREILESEAFRASAAKLPLALGKGIGGEPVIADLTRMPHLLVAGTTGSGKSVGVNAMILSLLYRLSPDDCRMIFIDPKMLELSVYNGIPHLLTPVVTDPAKAVAALNWAVGEMENRYRLMSQLSVRNIDVYNTRVRNGAPAEHAPMPHIVIVVDEFADLMAVAGKEIEFAVQRLAQMARAAGIHLIMATQRPSVDIITGTIKANFPTRISFRVTSRIDSRTILNEQGAEQLLGQGDMLYAAGSGQVVRVHGPFVSDEEVESIAAYLRTQGTPAYVDGVTDVPDPEPAPKAAEVIDEDLLYDRAVALVRADKKASISYLQRKLSIGYNRAADIIDRMEQDGLVSPPNTAGRREVLPPPSELAIETPNQPDPA